MENFLKIFSNLLSSILFIFVLLMLIWIGYNYFKTKEPETRTLKLKQNFIWLIGILVIGIFLYSLVNVLWSFLEKRGVSAQVGEFPPAPRIDYNFPPPLPPENTK